MKKVVYLFLVLLFATIFNGCSSVTTISESPREAGVSKIFKINKANANLEVKKAFESNKIKLKTEKELDEKNSEIVGQTPVTAFSYGEIIRVILEKTSEEETLVRILTKRVLATNVFAKSDWSPEIFSALETNEKDKNKEEIK